MSIQMHSNFITLVLILYKQIENHKHSRTSLYICKRLTFFVVVSMTPYSLYNLKNYWKLLRIILLLFCFADNLNTLCTFI